MINAVQEYNFAKLYVRRDIEEEIIEKFGFDYFSFAIRELDSGDFLTLSEHHINENEQLRNYLDVEGPQEDWESDELEDLAFSLINRLTKTKNVKTMILVEHRNVLLLG